MRFNEAGAFLLRKLQINLHLNHFPPRFNEAGAFLLRKRGRAPDPDALVPLLQ